MAVVVTAVVVAAVVVAAVVVAAVVVAAGRSRPGYGVGTALPPRPPFPRAAASPSRLI